MSGKFYMCSQDTIIIYSTSSKMTKTTCYPSCRSQFQNNSPPSCQLFQLNVQFFTDHQHVTAINKHLGRIKGKGYLASLAELLASDPGTKGKMPKHLQIGTYSVRIPSAVSRPSGVSQNTLAVSLLGSAVFSFTLGHWILGGSVSVETNVTGMSTCASFSAIFFFHSSCPAVSIITWDHQHSSTLEPSQPRQVEPVLLTFL